LDAFHLLDHGEPGEGARRGSGDPPHFQISHAKSAPVSSIRVSYTSRLVPAG
jgi:hypothetical protein